MALGMTRWCFFRLSAYAIPDSQGLQLPVRFLLMAGFRGTAVRSGSELLPEHSGLSLAISAGFPVLFFLQPSSCNQTTSIIHGGEDNYIMADD